MPFELQVIRAAEFVRVGPQGRLDLESSRQTLASLAQACRTRGLDRALLDLRTLPIPAAPWFTSAELGELVGTFREAGFGRRQWLAVLYQSDPHRGARTFAFISRMRGWRVRAFDDFESALLWLSEDPIEKQPRPAGRRIPIRFVETGDRMAGTDRARTARSRSASKAGS